MIPDRIRNIWAMQDADKGIFFIAISQFGIAFSFNCIMSFMPFYLFNISPYSHRDTMLWIGVIIGATSLISAVTAPFWGSLTSRFSPKALYLRGIICNGIIFLLMGFTTNLHIMLLLRIIQGTLGGVSTIGIIIISCSSSKERIPRHISLFQNSMTAGQLVGPPLGAFAVTLFGYQAPFIFSFIVSLVSFVFCLIYVRDIPLLEKERKTSASLKKGIFWGWVLSIVATINLTFLPSILPNILRDFHLTDLKAINYAGAIMMAYTATAILGNYFIAGMSIKAGFVRLIKLTCIATAILQLILTFTPDVVSFTLVRMLQTGFIAAVIPLVISTFAGEASGTMLGFLNSARFLGNALGPLMATTVLAYWNFHLLSIIIAALSLASLGGFLWSRPPRNP